MTTLYRIEHPDSGIGVFRHKLNKKEFLLDKHSKSKKILRRHESCDFPTFFSDESIVNELEKKDVWDTENYYCGYLSLRQLNKAFWLTEQKELFQLGFRKYKIIVKDCIKSEFQAIFKKDNIISQTEIV